MAGLGLMGKHPGYGDFLRAGMSEDLTRVLSAWLDSALMEVRAKTGAAWQPLWDGAPDLRFWIGPGLLRRHGAAVGVLRPSRDRAGRRYPLILAMEDWNWPAPVVSADQSLHDVLSGQLDRMQPGDDGARSLLDGLDPQTVPGERIPESAASVPPPMIWAHRPDGDSAALIESAAGPELANALAARCCFWTMGGTDTHGRPVSALWASGEQLPDAELLAWLLNGMRGTAQGGETGQ